MRPDDLLSLKDDMVAFIEGHGMRRLPGFVTEDIPTVLWEDETNADSWKDFVEMAKRAGAPFVTMSEIVLEKQDLEMLLEQIREDNYPDEDATELQEVVFSPSIGKNGGSSTPDLPTKASFSCMRPLPSGMSVTSIYSNLLRISAILSSEMTRTKKEVERRRFLHGTLAD